MTVSDTALYHYFDVGNRVLYIGISGNLGNRTLNHISKSRWMDLAARSTITRYPTRRKALEAERSAIWDERPLFNWQYNDTLQAKQRLIAYLTEIGRMDLYVDKKLGTGGLGELGQVKRGVPRVTAVPDHGGGLCPDDVDADYVSRVMLWHGLDARGKPVCPSGLVTLHVFDGNECAEVYLYASEARELAESLSRHADDALRPLADDEDDRPSSEFINDPKRRAA